MNKKNNIKNLNYKVLKYMFDNGGYYQVIDLQKVLIEAFFDSSKSNRPQIKRFLVGLEEEGLIKIEDRAGISFANDMNQIAYARENIHVKAILTQKGIGKITEMTQYKYKKRVDWINVSIGLVALIVSVYTIILSAKTSDLQNEIDDLENQVSSLEDEIYLLKNP